MFFTCCPCAVQSIKIQDLKQTHDFLEAPLKADGSWPCRPCGPCGLFCWDLCQTLFKLYFFFKTILLLNLNYKIHGSDCMNLRLLLKGSVHQLFSVAYRSMASQLELRLRKRFHICQATMPTDKCQVIANLTLYLFPQLT